jgi:L-iduronidase
MLRTLAPAAVAAVAAALNVTVDCAASGGGGTLPHFWRSCGYTPGEFALRPDDLENTVWAGSIPRRGLEQVRIHYLLDLLVVTGWQPDAAQPSGWALTYGFGMLDFALDWLVGNRLSPGFELMGSPVGFPFMPTSSYEPWNGNVAVQPAQTLAMWRTLVRDILLRYARRYGAAEVAAWRLASWNEPSCG